MDYNKEIEILCSLLKIEIQEKEKYVEHLKRMLEWCRVLDELDLEKYRPFIHSGLNRLKLREDIPIKFENTDKIIENFPERIERYLRAFSPIKEIKKK